MQGSCLCGLIRYELTGATRSVVACHCTQCRKTSGHYVAATQVADDDLTINGVDHLTWFKSSAKAQRGFCKTCGSQLFWRAFGTGMTSVMAGTLDGATGLIMDQQIMVAHKGDYYALPDVPVVSADMF